MIGSFDKALANLPDTAVPLGPNRYGLVSACDGGLLEVSGLAAPVGALCHLQHGAGRVLKSEVIGFSYGLSLRMLVGESVLVMTVVLV